MPSTHRVHSNHMGTWNKIFMSLSPDKQSDYEQRLDSTYKQIQELYNKQPASPEKEIVKKSPERLY